MTIEKLEALERAATAGPISVGMLDDGTLVLICDGDHVAELPWTGDEETQRATADVLAAARNALGPLLAVAKAAQKSLDQLSYILEVAHNEQQDEVLYPNMLSEIDTRREELRAAIAQLEATP